MPVAPTPAPRRAVTQPALKAVGQPVQLRRWVLAGAFIFAIAARLVLVQPDLKVPYQAAEPSEPAASPKSEGSP